MLYGCDLSHWNRTNDIKFDEQDFVILKATEGRSYKDKYTPKFYTDYTGNDYNNPSPDKLYGFYHYARPENNKPEIEANLFLKTIEPHIGNCMMALDVEGVALNYISWAEQWLDIIARETKIKPLIYIQGSATHKLQSIYEKGYGLWVAHYTKKKPNKGVYPFYAMWQYTSTPFDKDKFNGTAEQFKLYCR